MTADYGWNLGEEPNLDVQYDVNPNECIICTVENLILNYEFTEHLQLPYVGHSLFLSFLVYDAIIRFIPEVLFWQKLMIL